MTGLGTVAAEVDVVGVSGVDSGLLHRRRCPARVCAVTLTARHVGTLRSHSYPKGTTEQMDLH